ncbi:hydroxymethylbilane synthase [soil metagenome]
MGPGVLRLATRASPLALWQADHVAGLLRRAHPGLDVDVVRTDTVGDRRQDVPISEIGGKGVFATEVQQLVLDGRADAAVHSAKDLPAVTSEGLALVAVPERGDPRDALVGVALGALAEGATVATGSQRRRVQRADLRPDLHFVELRGNMATRVGKVGTERDGRTIDAIVVAAAALQRLGWGDRIDGLLTPEQMTPQVGQGTLAVEVRAGDDAAAALLAPIEDPVSRRRLDAERAFLAELGGDCDLPAGAYSSPPEDDGTLAMRALLAGDDDVVHRAEARGRDGVHLGVDLARRLRTAVDAA